MRRKNVSGNLLDVIGAGQILQGTVTVCTRIGSSGIKLLLVFYNKYSLITTEVLQTLQKSKV